ncbi:Beta-lactamase-like protein sdnR [Pseudocercospora fuligena]|uniref:Beta-lactamase-like protein sdnR n=1 Tax=Pseudocercospora fuligena TaxID=685502 RepID=A0A8H6VHQ1_9PEZI|nr:Beta-lactamase-like protein sdnR [Pseudocercospora fuligena]
MILLAAVILLFVAVRSDLTICPIKGQQFPKPTSLGKEATFLNATKTIEDYVKANLTQSPWNQTTFSLGLFSVDTDGLLYEYHHTDESVASSSIGTKAANADSIYRIASISKIFTVYLWLIKSGHKHFNSPITEFIPQLAESQPQDDYYPLPDWKEITVGDLAMFLGGIARDYGLNDVALSNYVTSMLPASINNLPDNEPEANVPVCGFFTAELNYSSCADQVYIRGLSELAASFPSAYTPSYSNANSLFWALHWQILDVIPGGDAQKSGWDNNLGPLAAAAGVYSTVNDLAIFGKSILNSSLIPASTTRRWFSTVSFVERQDQGVGHGWQIFRKKVGIRTVDMYAKDGYWGVYTSLFLIIPDYDFGIALLTASQNATGKVKNDLPNVVVNALLPVLEDIARQQSHQNFAGHYKTATGNSSVVITTDDWPALKVTEYISDGVDLLDTVFGLFGEDIDFRLIPNHLYPGPRKVGFTGVYQPPAKPLPEDQWYFPCQAWLDIDDFTYGNVPLGQMVFDVDETGRACSVQLTALQQKLDRKQV